MRNPYLRWIFALSLPLAFSLSCSGTTVNGGSPDDGGSGDGGNPNAPPTIPGCVGACTVNYNCPVEMGPTTLTGTVNIPAGTLPLYNAQVYIPTGNTLPPPPATGATCDRCVSMPGQFSTTTDASGHFKLTNVPSGQNIPLIVQVGKWRRVVNIPSITDCTSTPLDPTQTRLPRNQGEGNIPKIALSTGSLDALECVLRKNKLGLDDSEFTLPGPKGTGRVNLYAGVSGTDQYVAGGVAFPQSNPWWDTAANWQAYDIVMLSCEGAAVAWDLTKKSVQARQNLQTYLDLGGRVFASHWHNVWIAKSVALPAPSTEPPLSTLASFVDPAVYQGYSEDTLTDEATINTSFAKGAALQTWLANNGGLNNNMKLPINFTRVTLANTAPKPNPSTALTLDWLNLTNPATLDNRLEQTPSQYFSFYAPINAPSDSQCGQMVFTDLHVAGGPGGDKSAAGTQYAFPNGCTTTGLTPQEKALIFLLFDLTACVTPIIG
jgi:hypothetical protein